MEQIQKLVPTGTSILGNPGTTDNGFGAAVALHKGVLAISAVSSKDAPTSPGAVYTYAQNGAQAWVQAQKLTTGSQVLDDHFGNSIAISDKLLVVGAEGAGYNTGAAYVYTRAGAGSQWSEATKLTAEQGMADDRFGNVVAIDGETILIGAANRSIGEELNQGVVYILEKDSRNPTQWAQAEVWAQNGAAFDDFGRAAAIVGKTIAVGAPGHNDEKGAVYLFTRSQGANPRWEQVVQLALPAGASARRFGTAVALSSQLVVVGAKQSEQEGWLYYLFQRPQIATQAWGAAIPLPSASEKFGAAVGVQGKTVVISAHEASTTHTAGFVFGPTAQDPAQWRLVAELDADAPQDAKLGKVSLSIDQGAMAIGSAAMSIKNHPKPGAIMTYAASVFMRDNFSDTGTVPSTGILYGSPDIIPLTEQVIDSEQAFGGKNWNKFVSQNVESGQDNYIYLRAHNIGNAPASPVAHLFSSPNSSFIHPLAWTPIGTLDLGEIQPGEKVVRGPIVWDKAKITRLGHYCFICYLVDSGQSFPDPMTLTFTTAEEYYQFVADHNNMCFHNVNIVDQWDTESAFRSFIMVGMPELASAAYKLTITTDLPKSTPIQISIDDWSATIMADSGTVVVNEAVTLTAGQETKVTFLVDPIAAGDYTLRFSQYAQGTHLGAVSFKLHY